MVVQGNGTLSGASTVFLVTLGGLSVSIGPSISLVSINVPQTAIAEPDERKLDVPDVDFSKWGGDTESAVPKSEQKSAPKTEDESPEGGVDPSLSPESNGGRLDAGSLPPMADIEIAPTPPKLHVPVPSDEPLPLSKSSRDPWLWRSGRRHLFQDHGCDPVEVFNRATGKYEFYCPRCSRNLFVSSTKLILAH